MGEKEGVAAHGCKKGHHAAKTTFFRRIGEQEVQFAQFQPAHAQHRAIVSQDGNHQEHHILPGIGQPELFRPKGIFRQPPCRASKHPLISGQFGSVKFQLPTVVQFQLVFPGHIRDAAVKNHILVCRPLATQVGQPDIKAGPGKLRPRCLGIGGGI